MKVLITLGHYLPGFKAGGPTRSIASLVKHLGDEVEFYIVTRDRDLGDQIPYPNLPTNTWQQIGKSKVAHVSPGIRSCAWFLREVRKIAPHVIYLNSFFDWQFSLLPAMSVRCGAMSDVPMILAARGQFAASAMKLNWWKKRPYLAAFKSLGLQHRLLWHVTSEAERRDVAREFGPHVQTRLVPNLADVAKGAIAPRIKKLPGELKLVFLARVARVKNLVESIDMLASLPGRVWLDVWGPKEDAVYWQQCLDHIVRLPDNVCVKYRGVVAPDRVAPTLAQYDALLLPTRGENFGHAIVEALAAGCPVVISDRTPWRDLQRLGVGWDLPLESGEAFGRALATLSAMDEPAHQEMRVRAADFGRSVANPANSAAGYREMFQSAGSLTKPSSPAALWKAA